MILGILWSEMTLNYWMMVERYSNLKEEVVHSIPGCEISSLHDGKLARWSKVVYCLLCFGAGLSAFWLKTEKKRR
jgi:hypothetical protein